MTLVDAWLVPIAHGRHHMHRPRRPAAASGRGRPLALSIPSFIVLPYASMRVLPYPLHLYLCSLYRCIFVLLCRCISLSCCIVVLLYLVALLYRCFVASHRLVVSLCRCITSDRHDCGLPRDLRRASGAVRLLCCRLGGIFGLGDGIRVRVHGKLILRRATRHLVALVWVAHLETLV